LTQHAFDFESRGRLEVKGKAAPIEAWQAVGPKATPLSPRGLAGLRAPLVGRETQLGRLQARLAALRPDKPGGWVAVTGEAGLGKSRLIAELRALQAPDTVMWLEGRCISYGQGHQLPAVAPDHPPELGRSGGRASRVRARQAGILRLRVLSSARRRHSFLEAMLAVASKESLKRVMATPATIWCAR
jgi:hypothetical protein